MVIKNQISSICCLLIVFQFAKIFIKQQCKNSSDQNTKTVNFIWKNTNTSFWKVLSGIAWYNPRLQH